MKMLQHHRLGMPSFHFHFLHRLSKSLCTFSPGTIDTPMLRDPQFTGGTEEGYQKVRESSTITVSYDVLVDLAGEK